MARNKTARPRHAGRGGGTTGNWWDEVEEVPRAGLPDAEALSKRQRRYRRVVWATVFLTPLALFATFITVASAGDEGGNRTVAADRYTATRSKAIYAVRSWLAADPAPLPGGILLDWDYARSTRSPANPDSPGDGYTVETHHLTVAAPSGGLYDTTVALGVSPTRGAVVLGPPTLVPRAPADDTWDADLWPRLDDATYSEEVEAAVAAWATAYTSGDPAALRLAVGDGDASHAYVPLAGAHLTGLDVESAAGLFDADIPATERDDLDPDRLLVNVTARIWWDGVPVEDTNDLAEVSFDLLVHEADTAAPRVVAWGGAGTGPTLKPFQNAVTGIDLAPAETVDEEPEPTVVPRPDRDRKPRPAAGGTGPQQSADADAETAPEEGQ